MKRKSTKFKILEGNPGKRDLIREADPKSVMPKMPKDIDKAAQKVWKRLSPVLFRNGLLTEIDGESFALLCQIRARLQKVIRELNDAELIEIETIADQAGHEATRVKINPLLRLEKQFLILFKAYANDFGMSPRGRVGLSVSPDNDKSDFEKLLD